MKIVLITGVSRKDGIGFETARQLALQNYKVILSARNLDKAQALADELIADGLNAAAVEIDVTNESSLLAARKRLESVYGRIDVLINNAALMMFTTDTIENKKLSDLTMEIDTNLVGTWRVTQHILPLLMKSESGRIVNISSSMGSVYDPLWGMLEYSLGPIPAYSITKMALNGLTIAMAKELKEHNILVNAVCPGYTATHAGMEEGGARPVSESVGGIVWAATLPDEGPTGQFFRDKQAILW